MLPYVAHISGDFSRLHIAESAAENVVSAPNATPLVAKFARLGLGLIAVMQEDVKSAKEQYAYLKSLSGSNGLVNSDYVLGLLAHTLGDQDRAIGHFEDAQASCRKAAYLPHLAWACYGNAETLLKRNDAGDHGKAILLLDESLAISTELGMSPLVERVQARMETLSA